MVDNLDPVYTNIKDDPAREEWIKILEYCEYGGDYFFTNSTVLELTT